MRQLDIDLITVAQELMAESGEPYRREIRLDSSLQRQLRLDSLGRAELFRRIEKKFHITLPDRLLAEAETLKDIAEHLQEAQSSIWQPTYRDVITSHGERPHLDLHKARTLQDVLIMYGEHTPD